MWFPNDDCLNWSLWDTCDFGFEGCIVRGQWWPMESKAWNYIQGHGHFERSSQGFESWWHFYFSNFWPGLKKELFGVALFICCCDWFSNIFKISWQPHFRRPIFNAPDFTWSVEWTTFGETFHYFVYILKKVGPCNLTCFSYSDKNKCLFLIILRYCYQDLNIWVFYQNPQFHLLPFIVNTHSGPLNLNLTSRCQFGSSHLYFVLQ